LRLQRDVEGRDRLIKDNKLRIDGESSGDHESLTLSTRKLVRIKLPDRRIHSN
jgi:hypothetical protein